jgi:hypothetical protein
MLIYVNIMEIVFTNCETYLYIKLNLLVANCCVLFIQVKINTDFLILDFI